MAPSDCRHCGLPDCETRFQQCLTLDFSAPGYGAVHHLVVPTWMLQHDAYVDAVRPGIVHFVLAHLDRPPSARTMAAIRAATGGPVRVTRREPPEEDTSAGARPWGLTVADVDASSATAYRRTVRAWAESVAHQAG